MYIFTTFERNNKIKIFNFQQFFDLNAYPTVAKSAIFVGEQFSHHVMNNKQMAYTKLNGISIILVNEAHEILRMPKNHRITSKWRKREKKREDYKRPKQMNAVTEFTWILCTADGGFFSLYFDVYSPHLLVMCISSQCVRNQIQRFFCCCLVCRWWFGRCQIIKIAKLFRNDQRFACFSKATN